MGVLATRKWSDWEIEADSARIHFEVSDAPTAQAAIDAVASQHNVGIGSQHPDDPTLIVLKRPRVIGGNEPFVLREIIVEFERPEVPSSGGGDDSDLTPEQKLALPVRVKWNKIDESIPAYRDRQGYPIVNGAGDPALRPPTRIRRSWTITLSRWLTAFPIELIDEFDDTVNDGEVTIRNAANQIILRFPPKTIRVVDMDAPDEYAVDDPVVRFALTLHLKTDPDEPHRVPVSNEGWNGWWNDGGTKRKAQFTRLDESNGNYVPVPAPVLLSGNGLPRDSTVRVGTGGATPIANRDGAPPGWIDDSGERNPRSIQCWELYRDVKNFTPLFQALGLQT